MKHVSKILSDIDGISIYPIIGLIIFFTIFVIVVVYVFSTKKEIFKDVQNLPLEEGDYADSKNELN